MFYNIYSIVRTLYEQQARKQAAVSLRAKSLCAYGSTGTTTHTYTCEETVMRERYVQVAAQRRRLAVTSSTALQHTQHNINRHTQQPSSHTHKRLRVDVVVVDVLAPVNIFPRQRALALHHQHQHHQHTFYCYTFFSLPVNISPT